MMNILGYEIKPLTLGEYMAAWRARNELSLSGLDKYERRMRHYARYNLDRQQSVESRWSPSEEFLATVESLEGPQTWLFITDPWCIDSAYSLPLLVEAARRRRDIDLHILMKDDSLEILDQYLTDGRRSIPILAAFDAGGAPLFRWGPHPDELEKIRRALQDAGEPGSKVSGATIEWYENYGELGVEKELTTLFSTRRGSVP